MNPESLIDSKICIIPYRFNTSSMSRSINSVELFELGYSLEVVLPDSFKIFVL